MPTCKQKPYAVVVFVLGYYIWDNKNEIEGDFEVSCYFLKYSMHSKVARGNAAFSNTLLHIKAICLIACLLYLEAYKKQQMGYKI